ncbi:MAG: PQQ-dependent sugar dehydrogenase [Balneolales bacterium]
MHYLFSLLLIIVIFGCEQNISEQPITDENYQVIVAFPELTFTRPVDFQQPNDGTNRSFVVEQRGVIFVFPNDSAISDASVFLDISDKVEDSSNEEGLLGLAFHPDFSSNGYFYVNYTASDPDRTVIARFQVSDNPDLADEASEQEILSFEQPYGNHNGGQVSFGPDGYLYIAVGDGGSGGDPQENGQDRSTLLGTILRIDIDNQESERNYAIPPDNPFADNDDGYREEIYAWGLRNPWRFSFDPENDNLWTGDVGQNTYEEINIVESGKNYGWNIMEASHCFEPSTGCDQSGLELPIWEYDRSEGDISVTGGFVYRGPTLSSLKGRYIYADYVSGRIWALDYSDLDNPSNTELLQADFAIPSFGVDLENELYILGFDGKIYRLETETN